MKEIEIECPCCGSRIWVDARSGAVMRSRRAREEDESGKPVVHEADWDAANAQVKGRMVSAADRFEQSLTKERRKGQDLDERFQRANEELKRDDAEGKGC
jgi:hypothetical protein